ncbi:phosphoserine phosphatase [Klebsiella pneumoniae]|uniref:Phosphoserine phosphatase n=1 Tax=Klebsiella pneumoniae TaxID=573 RepID=A0A378BCH4_KLEPN|nr:phosphoserine phosphatase [Klebsiella pneumoniae]
MPNSLTWCDLPEDVSLWPGLPLSLSGDEVMPLDYHAGRSGWLLYGRGLDKRRLTAWQRELGAALVIVASWVVEDYQVIRLAGSLTPRATRLAHEAGLDVAPLGKIPHLRTPGLLVMTWTPRRFRSNASMRSRNWPAPASWSRKYRAGDAWRAGLHRQPAPARGDAERRRSSILLQVRDALPLMPGLAQLVLKLETLGWKVAIASGGFTFFAEYLRDKLHLDAVFANELEIRDGKLTGNVLGDIVDAKYKANTLRKLAEKYEIPTAQTVAIGDGANDLPMIKAAGLGIAYHAKPKVNEQAEVTIRHADLMGVFCILSGSMNQK